MLPDEHQKFQVRKREEEQRLTDNPGRSSEGDREMKTSCDVSESRIDQVSKPVNDRLSYAGRQVNVARSRYVCIMQL
jgi:hypothetical protein